MILESRDGAENWEVQIDGLSAPLNALHFKDGYGWAVGENGLVLRYRDPTFIEDDKNLLGIIPDKFELKQNYPNPFNPETVISWQLAVGSHVELSVYDLLGKKVATLVSKRMAAGNHTYTFDGKNLASGIYYYQLLAGNFREVKKMILLR